jgi:multidrug resistance efflux pump
MKKLSVFFVLLAATVLVLSGCSTKTAQAASLPTTSQPNVMVAEGRLLPVNSLDQSFPISGQIAEVLVKDGDAVKVGQVLARLSSSPEAALALARAKQEALAAQQALDNLKASADVKLAQGQLAVIAAQKLNDTAQNNYDSNTSDENKAKLDEAAANLKLAKDALLKLEDGKGLDPDQLEAAQARLASANAAVDSSQAALDALELKSSMDGKVVDLTLQVGQQITAGQPVMTVADFSSWIVNTDNLTEVEVVNVKVGQKVNIILDALPSVTLTGEVTHINKRFEETRGDITYTVTTVLNQTDARMRWGMTAAVNFLP